MSILIIPADFDDILALPEASYFTDKQQLIPWLQWLIIEGDKVIVRDYDFSVRNNRFSRTGLGIMVEGAGRRWKVPAEFSGTVQNNFITRALRDADREIEDIIINEII